MLGPFLQHGLGQVECFGIGAAGKICVCQFRRRLDIVGILFVLLQQLGEGLLPRVLKATDAERQLLEVFQVLSLELFLGDTQHKRQCLGRGQPIGVCFEHVSLPLNTPAREHELHVQLRLAVSHLPIPA